MSKRFEGIAIFIAIIGVIIALLAWLAPFSPIGTSPLGHQGASTTLFNGTVSVPATSQPANTLLPASTPSQSPTKIPIPPPLNSMISEKDGMVLLYVPEGEFLMGSKSGYADELPAHQVSLDPFWIDQTEVTNAMYANCVNAHKCDPPGKTDHFSDSSYANHPVVYVDWNMANAYCSWVGRRLPTEAEWEKAARGTDGRIYPWGNDIQNRDLANFTGTVGDTTEVGRYINGASPYGALDMAGNVWEWVSDWYDANYYQVTVFLNPPGPSSGTDRVLKGGSWYQLDGDLRSANRHWDVPFLADNPDVGFRCANLP
jgi:formylglycine-generating enzyme required for sulfatase activity